MSMEAKEGIVLDRDGNQLYEPRSNASSGQTTGRTGIRIIQGGWGLLAVLLLVVPLFLVAGLVILATAVTFFTVLWLLRVLFGGQSRRGLLS